MAIDFPTSLDSWDARQDNVDDCDEDMINNIEDALEALEAKVGADGSEVETSHDFLIAAMGTLVNNFIASGRKLYLYENTAPTGWTIVSVTDRVLAVKGGANAYNVNGGNPGGAWAQPDHVHAGPSHSHSHSHRWYGISGSGPYLGGTNVVAFSIDTDTDSTPGGTGDTGNGATVNSWRPAAAVGIIVSKDA